MEYTGELQFLCYTRNRDTTSALLRIIEVLTTARHYEQKINVKTVQVTKNYYNITHKGEFRLQKQRFL